MQEIKKIILWIFIIGSFLLPGNLYAEVKQRTILTVADIKVSEIAEDSRKAREKAINAGQIEAFNKLLASLIQPADKEKIDKVREGDIASALQGFQVNNEKITDNSYSASLTVSFYQDAVKDILAKAGVVLIDKEAPPILVLPIMREGGKLLLWETGNKWKEAWDKFASANNFIHIVIPLGDLEDIKNMKSADITSADYQVLQAFSEKYRAKDVIIAEADIQTGEKSSKTLITMRSTAGSLIPTSQMSFEAETITEEKLYKFVEELVIKNKESWLINADKNPYRKVKTGIYFSGLDDWLYKKNRLESMNSIEKLEVHEISSSNAVFDLYYKGSFSELSDYLRSKGIGLFREEGLWIIEDGKNE